MVISVRYDSHIMFDRPVCSQLTHSQQHCHLGTAYIVEIECVDRRGVLYNASVLSGRVKSWLNPRCAKWFLMTKAHDLCPEAAKLREVRNAREVREFGSLEIMW